MSNAIVHQALVEQRQSPGRQSAVPKRKLQAPQLDIHACTRRQALLVPSSALTIFLALPRSAAASKLPEAADRAWEAMGGGPADLAYPESFLGIWNVSSVLENIDLPQGPEAVPDMSVVQRAQEQDKGRVVRYQAAFVKNTRGQIVADRRFNTASLMHTYLGLEEEAVAKRIEWNIADPNRLDMSLPGGMQVMTRVTRRSEDDGRAAESRLETSEFFEQVMDSEMQKAPKVKASQAFTKYHWRSPETAGNGPEIIATQVVSDYPTPYGGDAQLLLGGGSKPVTIYTYRMSFFRQQTS